MKNLFEYIRRKSGKTGYPLYWLWLYLPGFVLAAVLIPKPLKLIGSLALFFTELWEIGMLHTIANRVSVIFLPVIIMHPFIISIIHLCSLLFVIIGLGKSMVIPDESLLKLRLGYVIAAYVGIALSVILREGNSRK